MKSKNKKSPGVWIFFFLVLTAGAVFLYFSPVSPFRKDVEPVVKTVSITPEQKSGQKRFSKLEITSVTFENGQIKVIGISDLPENSILSVGFDIIGRSDTGGDSGVNVRTTISGGAFTAGIYPPKTPEFAHDPYVVDALFSPRNQPESVLAAVGKDGEYLEGDTVKERFGFRILETEKKADIQIK
jgi:hypothetical protein